MAIEQAIKDIQPWAEDGDRELPGDVGLTRGSGWPVQYEQVGGTPPERTIFNQLFFELTDLFAAIREHGLPLPWDTRVNYVHPAFAKVGGVIYKTLVNTGPGSGNAAEPGTDDADGIWEEY